MSDLEFSAIEDHNQQQSDYPSFFLNHVHAIIQQSSSKQQSRFNPNYDPEISFTIQLDRQVRKSQNAHGNVANSSKSYYMKEQVDLAVSVFQLILQEIERQRKISAFSKIKLAYIQTMSKAKAIIQLAEQQSHLLTCTNQFGDQQLQFQSFGIKKQILTPKQNNNNQSSGSSKKEIKLKSYRKYETTDDETIPKQETIIKNKKYKDKENKQKKQKIFFYDIYQEVQKKTTRKYQNISTKNNKNTVYKRYQQNLIFPNYLSDCSNCQYCKKIAAMKKKTQRLLL